MKLGSTRELSSLKPVLKDSDSTGPDPVYWVFSEVSDDKWANVTVIVSGDYNGPARNALQSDAGGEFPKTFGHYHPEDASDETYHLIEGEGVLVMQKKHFEDGVFIDDIVDEVYLVKAKAGDEIKITKDWGHSWSNVGKGPLISFDDWRSGHTPLDYKAIEKLHGLAYYLISEEGEIKAVPNSNYKNLPEPIWVTAEEFREKSI